MVKSTWTSEDKRQILARVKLEQRQEEAKLWREAIFTGTSSDLMAWIKKRWTDLDLDAKKEQSVDIELEKCFVRVLRARMEEAQFVRSPEESKARCEELSRGIETNERRIKEFETSIPLPKCDD